MTVFVALLAQLGHVLLMVLAAPTLAGACGTIEARLDGRSGPPVLQVWRDLLRLTRKRPIFVEGTSPVTRIAPVLCLAISGAAAALVPSFTLDMAFAPIADLVAIVALLNLIGAIRALVALDAGSAGAGLIASRGMRLALFGQPALLLAVFTLALLAGTTDLDLIVALQREGLIQPEAASALAAAALVTVVVTQDRHTADPERNGATLAMTQAADGFATLAWLDLIAVLFLPLGLADADAGPTLCLIGLLAWLVKLCLLTVALAGCRRIIGHRRPRMAAELLAIGGLFGLVGAVFALSSASGA